jgi:hypothetical protein
LLATCRWNTFDHNCEVVFLALLPSGIALRNEFPALFQAVIGTAPSQENTKVIERFAHGIEQGRCVVRTISPDADGMAVKEHRFSLRRIANRAKRRDSQAARHCRQAEDAVIGMTSGSTVLVFRCEPGR